MRGVAAVLVVLCRFFKAAVEKQQDPVEFVEGLKKQGKRVSGIGHRIKSKDNRDARVELLQQYARKVRHRPLSLGCALWLLVCRATIRTAQCEHVSPHGPLQRQGFSPATAAPGGSSRGAAAVGVSHSVMMVVVLLLSWLQFFPGHKHLDYALKVEEYTLSKAANLVLNVDGCIAGGALICKGVGSWVQGGRVWGRGVQQQVVQES